jgi:hypothetical protein
VSEFLCRQSAQLIIDQRQQSGRSVRIAGLNVGEKARDFVHDP